MKRSAVLLRLGLALLCLVHLLVGKLDVVSEAHQYPDTIMMAEPSPSVKHSPEKCRSWR